MGPLRTAWMVALMGLASTPDPVGRWAGLIADASARFGVPEAWIRRVITAESGGATTWKGKPIESRAGALGLMQLMPGTWRELRDAYHLGPDPHDPHDNIIAGTAYLKAMYDRFGYPGLFAAYNAGPGRYAEHLATGRRLPAETVAYVAAVAGGGARASKRSLDRPAQDRMFFDSTVPTGVRGEGGERGAAPQAGDGGLFVPLSSPG